MADVDIGEELLKAVRTDFRKELGDKDSRLAKILKRIQDGKGSMHDAAMFSKECGAALSEAIAKNVTPDKLPDGQLYYNIADTILRSTLKDNYDLVNMAAQAAQEQTDNKLNLHLAPQQAAFPEDRVHKIVNAAADQTADSDTIKRRLDSPVRNVTESFYDDFVEENAEFRDEAGLKTYLVRQTNGKCCDWCASLAGRYIYEDAPEDVFAKHDNCTCTVEYIMDKYRENVHTKKRYALSPKERSEILKNAPKPTRFTKEQAKDLLNKVLNKLANSGESGIINVSKCTDFSQIEVYLKNKYNIDLDSSVKGLDFKSCKQALIGVESIISEYPELADSLKKVTISNSGIMCCNGKEICFNPNYFNDPKKLRKVCNDMSSSGYWVNNCTPASIGVHEAAHAVEQLLIDYNQNYINGSEKVMAWNNCTEAKTIVEQAISDIKKTPYGKGQKEKQLVKAISIYAGKNESETMAESFADVFANGKNANPLSIRIKELTINQYKKYKGAS